ncbi:hypothetical protein F4824DRAFT_504499 [Ustulina deusta]|nr:hypothetical protein F4824DRAFT_504499 [Ustulina deusta]
MRGDARSRSGRGSLPSRPASSRYSNVSDNRSEDQPTTSRQHNPYRAPADRQDTPSPRAEQVHRGSAFQSNVHDEIPHREPASESLDTAGAKWPLVDPSGVLYYLDDPIASIEPDLLREVISSGSSWSPASRDNSPFCTYASLAGDYEQAGDTSRPSNALRPINSSRAGSASLAGISSRAGSVLRVGDRPVSPIEHDW